MGSTIRLGKIAGIDIGIHYSWFFILALVTWSLASAFFPSLNPQWSGVLRWGLALNSAILLFVSVLIHELAHSLVAKSRGFPVEGITLFILGGVSSLRAEARQARDEFIISAVGPATSFVLFGIFLLLLIAVGGEILAPTPMARVAESVSPLEAVLGYLWFINLLLAFFNMLPAFPLDGGRVLRSIIWGTTGNFAKATRIAARGGQLIGLFMIVWGIVQVIFQGNLGGLWFALIGWFLQSSAGTSLREMEVETVMRGIQVKDVMNRDPATIAPNATIYDAVYKYLFQQGIRALPVCDDDRLVGIISLTDIRGIPQDRWLEAMVGDVMTPAPLKSVTPDNELIRALELLGEYSVHQAPVLEGDQLVGLLTRANIIEHLHRRKELGIDLQQSSAGPTERRSP